MDATIVIPTKNGGEIFKQVLDAVFNQKTQFQYEVVCVDSGSTDDTLETIQSYPVILKQIDKTEFGHGKTRNLGASLGSGEYIVFITQDALPADEYWLDNFIKAMKENPDVVGGFGRHIPYPDCNLLDKRDLKAHFENFGLTTTVYSLDDAERYKNDEAYRHYLAFFSDNNSCVRRDVFEQYPYEDVNFAEDQIWARKMIEMGFKKLYAPDATVYHSHNFPLDEYRKRYFDEYKGLYKLHHYVMAASMFKGFPLFLKLYESDKNYIKGLDLSSSEKKGWIHYARKRNWYRVTSAVKAYKYCNSDERTQEKMDQKLSQQFEQRSK